MLRMAVLDVQKPQPSQRAHSGFSVPPYRGLSSHSGSKDASQEASNSTEVLEGTNDDSWPFSALRILPCLVHSLEDVLLSKPL